LAAWRHAKAAKVSLGGLPLRCVCVEVFCVERCSNVAYERVLSKLDRQPSDVAVQERERTSIETKMIRFRYGPWDARYRRWLGLLSSRGLVRLAVEGNTVVIGLTDAGRALVETIKSDALFSVLARRSDLTIKAVGSMSATRLKDFVYEAIPEITDMKWGEEITL
jgi:hypothetical protein